MLTRTHPVQKHLLAFAFALFWSCRPNMALAQSVPILVQAEAMTLNPASTGPMAVGYDIAAMGGRFISQASGTPPATPSLAASKQVTVPNGTYYLWARIAGPSATSDALNVGIDGSVARVFPGTQGPYEWVKVPRTSNPVTYEFALDGTHSIEVSSAEVGAKLDALYLTADAAEVPGFAAPRRLLIEAEAMTLQPASQMLVVTDEPGALGQSYLTTTAPNTTTPPQRASVQVHLPAGSYYLWARVGGPTINNDAMYLGIGGSFARTFPEPTAPFGWARVKISLTSSAVEFVLPAGIHTIQVGEGETNARLDAIYLTDNATEVPTFKPMRRIIEAESFVLEPSSTPPMTVGTDANANGAQYIAAESGTSPPSQIAAASTTVHVTNGNVPYFLWARIKGATATSDAIYLGIDGTWNRVFPHGSGAYEWVQVKSDEDTGRLDFALSAGQHAIQVAVGEIGARLDAVYVTDDANDSPSGSTQPPSGDFPAACALPSGGYQGFGHNTLLDTNLPARTVYEVTRLDDPSGAIQGTLRDALSQPNRCIRFNLPAGSNGEINLDSKVIVRSNVMIDGFTAPAPGITIMSNQVPKDPKANKDSPALDIDSATHVVVRGIRVRKAPGDGIRILNSTNVVIDHVSVTQYRDGAVDATGENTRNVTIQWSILGEGQPIDGVSSKVNLNGHNAAAITVHHNLYINGNDRQPFCGWFDTATTSAPHLILDARNNLIWNHDTGTNLQDGCTANIVKNYYWSNRTSTGKTIWVPDADLDNVSVHVSENVRQASSENINSRNNRSEWPLSVPAPATTDARTAARAVASTSNSRNGAGARGANFGLDSVDQTFINDINTVGIQ